MEPVSGFLAGKLFKLLGVAGIIGSVVLAVMLLGAKIEIRSLNKTVQQRDDQIVVLNRNLAQARTNVAMLETGITQQNIKIRNLEEDGKRRLAEASKQVAAAKAETVKASRRADEMLRYKPKGDSAGERMLDVDRRFLETLGGKEPPGETS